MENQEKGKLPVGYDEMFKIMTVDFFGSFAEVKTDFEIIDLPKRVDILIIETTAPIEQYVEIFKYFKRFNIIEFKSEDNRFVLNEDLYKLGIYINGFMLKETGADIDNTTFTLVASRRPAKLLKQYNAREIRQGLYVIEKISVIPIHVAVADELEISYEKEISYIKGFSSRNKRYEYLKGILQNLKREKHKKYLLEKLMFLYYIEIAKISIEEGIMTKIERNIHRMIKDFGFDKEWKEEGMLQGIHQEHERSSKEKEKQNMEIAIKLLSRGLTVDDVADITGLTKSQVRKLKN